MKELSTEEKAKRYDEALERCRKLYNEANANGYTSDIEDYETIFPELKESEDEMVRKELLDFCKNRAENYPNDPKYKNISAWIAWLKSLRPQNRWKPSDEMLEALYRAVPENVMEISEDEMLLDKLYQGLKYGRVLSEK